MSYEDSDVRVCLARIEERQDQMRDTLEELRQKVSEFEAIKNKGASYIVVASIILSAIFAGGTQLVKKIASLL